MSFRYSEELVEQVLAASDLVEIISAYSPLKRKGKSYKGICPFHQEKTPSFVVDAEKGLYHCFGCGAGGNLFGFLQAVEKISFPEAIELAAQRAGISLPNTRNPEEEKRYRRKKELIEIHEEAVSFFQRQLLKNKKAMEYLKHRGYTEKTIEIFELGYAPPSWDGLLTYFRKKDTPLSLLEEAGLIHPRRTGDGYYDGFRNRIIFPIHSYRGEVLGFGGRVLDDSNPKYLNSPQTILFNKKDMLYGLYHSREFLREKGEAIMVEGYTDVISAYQEGIYGLVASLGTALTPSQVQLLKKYASKVYIGYDADSAGTRATWRGLDLLEEVDLKVSVLPIPMDSDPDTLIKEKGGGAFLSLLDSSLSLFDFKLQVILQEKDIYNAEEKVEASLEIFKLLYAVKNRIKQEEYLKKVSSLLDTSLSALKEEFHHFIVIKRKEEGKKKKRAVSVSPPRLNLKKELLMRSEEKILMHFIHVSNHRTLIKEMILPDDYYTSKGKELARFLYQREDLLLKGPDRVLAFLEQEDLKMYYTYLQVRCEKEKDENPLLSIRRLKEYTWMEKKNKIWDEIREKKKDHDLRGLNRLLLTFSRLLAEEEKFEERRGNYAG